MVETGKRKKKT